MHDGPAVSRARHEHPIAHEPIMFKRNPKPRGVAALRVSCLVVLVGVAAVVLRQSPATTALPATAQGALLSGSPGTLIGPAREKSVSFLVLLRSAARPTCLVQWASSARLSVRWPAGQRWATISGAPGNVDRSFHLSIDDYRSPTGSVVFAADHQAAVPSGVCGEVAGVGTIHSFIEPTNSDVPQGGLSSVDLMRAYDAFPLTNSGFDGQGETVVFMEGGGFLQSDFNTFAADEKLPPYNLTLVGKNTGFDDETTMDIETVHEIAPQAHLVFFNLNAISNATSDADLFAQAFLEAAKLWPGAIVSMSLGECESNMQAFNDSDLVALNSTVMSIEAKGSTVFASSGDAGGLDCTPNSDDGQPPQSSFEGVLVPASLPAVTGTGGTSLTTDAAATTSARRRGRSRCCPRAREAECRDTLRGPLGRPGSAPGDRSTRATISRCLTWAPTRTRPPATPSSKMGRQPKVGEPHWPPPPGRGSRLSWTRTSGPTTIPRSDSSTRSSSTSRAPLSPIRPSTTSRWAGTTSMPPLLGTT